MQVFVGLREGCHFGIQGFHVLVALNFFFLNKKKIVSIFLWEVKLVLILSG